MANPHYKKNPAIPSIVSDFMSAKGRVGGWLSAHKRHGIPLPADIAQQQLAKAKAKAKKEAEIKKTKAKLAELRAQVV